MSATARVSRDALAPSVGAALDIGSNSVHLLVARVGPGPLEPVLDESALLGLGDVVDREGRVPEADRARLRETLRLFLRHAGDLGARGMIVLGTEPLRRASDRDEVVAEIARATGQRPAILSHKAEAYLTFIGVTDGRPPDDPILVVDIGGGSTEAILGGRRVAAIRALATGSARLTALHVAHDPPTPAELRALRDDASAHAGSLPDGRPARIVFVGGTASNVLRVARRRAATGPLRRADVADVWRILQALPASALVARYGVNRRRAGQLAAGLAMLEAVMARYAARVVEVSDASLRDGAILAEGLAPGAWLEALPAIATGSR